MNVDDWIEWETRKKEEAEDLKEELVDIASKNPKAKEFAIVMNACLEWEWQKHAALFLGGNESKEELRAFRKGIELAQRVLNNAIQE